jgi:hypothetical protein
VERYLPLGIAAIWRTLSIGVPHPRAKWAGEAIFVRREEKQMRVGNKNDEEGKKDRGAASRRGKKMEKRVFGGADWNKESER